MKGAAALGAARDDDFLTSLHRRAVFSPDSPGSGATRTVLSVALGNARPENRDVAAIPLRGAVRQLLDEDLDAVCADLTAVPR